MGNTEHTLKSVPFGPDPYFALTPILLGPDPYFALYVDGVLVDSMVGAGLSDNGSPTPLYIGENPESTGRYHNGGIDDVGMWGRVLSSSEVTEIYEAGLNGIALGEIGIPEPSTGALLALAVSALVCRRRRR